MSFRSTILAAALGVAAFTGIALAQDQGGQGQGQGQNRQDNGGGGGGQDRGGRRGNWDPAQMQQRFMEMMKEQLKVQDDEWKVLQPKLEKVMTVSRDLRGGGFGRGGFGGPGGGRGGDNNNDQPQSEVAKASRELRTTLQNDSASAADIEAKLTAFRAAREKANEELKAAREDLKGVLTQRQEAVLVMMGVLE